MISFKEFLQEAPNVQARWKSDDLEIAKAIELLNKHCKNGVKAIAADAVLYRGFYDLPGKTNVKMIDTTESARSSRDTNNIYQLMMNVSIPLKAYPKRSNSIICSRSIEEANNYGTLCAVIPFDGTRVAMSSARDFITYSIEKDTGFFTKHSDISDVSYQMGEFIRGGLDIKPDKGEAYINAERLDQLMAAFTPEEMAVQYCKSNDLYAFNTDVDEKTQDKIEKLYNVLKPGKTTAATLRELANYVLRVGAQKAFDEDAYKAYKLFKANPTAPFTGIASRVMTPSVLGLSLYTWGKGEHPQGYDEECWFSGKAIVIRIALFNRILKAMQARDKSSVHDDTAGQVEDLANRNKDEDED